MRRYQVFMESLEGLGKGAVYEVETLEHVWSWLDMAFSSDAPAQLWWVKDCQAGKVVAEMQTGTAWQEKFRAPGDFLSYLSQHPGWAR